MATIKANELLPFNLDQLDSVQVQDEWWLLLAIVPLVLAIVHFRARKRWAEINFFNPAVKEASIAKSRKWPGHVSTLLMCLLMLALVYPAARPVNATVQEEEKALLIWVYDASESMSTEDVQSESQSVSRLTASITALENSLAEIPQDYYKLLISYSGSEEVVTGLPTLNNSELLNQAHNIVQGERTATDYGLEEAFSVCQQFFNSLDNYPCEVFLLSDGECNPRPQCRVRSQELTAEAHSKGIVLHTVSWGDPTSDYRPNPQDNADLARSGGGQHLESTQVDELAQLYGDVAMGIDSEITYQSLASSYVWLARTMIILLTLLFFLRRIE